MTQYGPNIFVNHIQKFIITKRSIYTIHLSIYQAPCDDADPSNICISALPIHELIHVAYNYDE